MPNSATKTLKLNEFPTVEVQGYDGRLAVPSEIVAPGIAITPYLDLAEGTYQLGGGFRLTHVRTGYAFVAGQACIECARSAATRLAALEVDWDLVDPGDKAKSTAALGEALPAAMKAMGQFQNCQQQVCQLDDDGELEECEACGFKGSHAPFCISMVVPMVPAHQEATTTRPNPMGGEGA